MLDRWLAQLNIGLIAALIWFSAAVMAPVRLAGQQAASKPGLTSSTSPLPVKITNLLGKPAPAFSVLTLEGEPVSLADYKSKVILVNFWATWCGNCKLEMPWLAQLRDKYAAQGFEVLGIITDNAPPEKIGSLTRKYGVQYPILLCNHATAQAYGGLPDLPESFFIDRHGNVVAVMEGADSQQEIEANVLKALGRH